MQSRIDNLEKIVAQQSRAIREQENYSRRNNIVILGISEKEREKNEDLEVELLILLNKLLSEKEKIGVNDIGNMHRLPSKEGKIRPVIVRLLSVRKVNQVFYSCWKLKKINEERKKENKGPIVFLRNYEKLTSELYKKGNVIRMKMKQEGKEV